MFTQIITLNMPDIYQSQCTPSN